MQLELKELIRPNRVQPDVLTSSDTFGRFVAEPFERGFGTTIGNSLRRILLSSIQGAAATSVRIDGVDHEFTGIPGAVEDVNDLILNLKQTVFKIEGADEPVVLYIEKDGPGELKAGDFELPEGIRVLNPEQVLLTLTGGATVRMEVTVSVGRGYEPAVYGPMEGKEDIGPIPIDASFSPIVNVKYMVSNARVGQTTDYDRLVLEVTTNGSISPAEAVSYAAKILRDHLDLFIRPEEAGGAARGAAAEEGGEVGMGTVEELQAKLDRSIEELELSVRSYNCLEAAGIKTIRDLVQKSEGEMLKYRNFGRKSLSEIKQILKDMGLGFNMRLDDRGMPVLSDEKR